MLKSLILLGAAAAALLAYSDADLDGVDDLRDRCPNTAMTDLVDADGCPVASLVGTRSMDLVAGVAYSGGSSGLAAGEGEDTAGFSLQWDYYPTASFSLQVAASWYDSKYSDGLGDTLIAGYYVIKPADNLLVRLGAGVWLPTYDSGLDNEAADYQGSLNVSYTPGRTTLFGGYAYTLINDDDVYGVSGIGDVRYQNTGAWNAGAGYAFTPSFYMSAGYGSAQSIYRGVERLDSLSLYGFYTIDARRFATFNYSAGLSDSAPDHAFSIRLGYYF